MNIIIPSARFRCPDAAKIKAGSGQACAERVRDAKTICHRCEHHLVHFLVTSIRNILAFHVRIAFVCAKSGALLSPLSRVPGEQEERRILKQPQIDRQLPRKDQGLKDVGIHHP
jgi:hypothetical protein